jgi:hypothetical protein
MMSDYQSKIEALEFERDKSNKENKKHVKELREELNNEKLTV